MNGSWFFSTWSGIGRIFLIGTRVYGALILLLRVWGKRTLAAMNAFELIVAVAFGSTLATVLLLEQVSLFEGVTAFAVLLSLQFAATWLEGRSFRWGDLLKAQPSLIYFRG